MKKPPAAFLSYVRSDDQHENGRLTTFRERLAGEIRLQIGEEFPIFQDRQDIAWGQQWKARIEESIDAVTFLVPILTPGFFKSPACREELERFLEREKKLGRGDLILPVYYVRCPVLDVPEKRAQDDLAELLAKRQYADWRELRFEPFTSPQVQRTLARLAEQVTEALDRPAVAPPPKLAKAALEAPKLERVHTQAALELKGPMLREPAGIVPKSEPPTRYVDAMHRGDHATLAAAIQAAKAGDRIVMRPGLYRESVVIDKPLEIIGDGELGEVVIEASDKPAIDFRATMGRLSNLTLRLMGGENEACLSISQGRLEVEGCDISSPGGRCVEIVAGADPRLRRSRIHDGSLGGIDIEGAGTIEDNDICTNGKFGIGVYYGGNPVIKNNQIHHNLMDGIDVSLGGASKIEDNDIFCNAGDGVSVVAGGKPALRRNRISENGAAGVWVSSGGFGIFENNVFKNNHDGPFQITDDSLANVTRSGNIES